MRESEILEILWNMSVAVMLHRYKRAEWRELHEKEVRDYNKKYRIEHRKKMVKHGK